MGISRRRGRLGVSSPTPSWVSTGCSPFSCRCLSTDSGNCIRFSLLQAQVAAPKLHTVPCSFPTSVKSSFVEFCWNDPVRVCPLSSCQNPDWWSHEWAGWPWSYQLRPWFSHLYHGNEQASSYTLIPEFSLVYSRYKALNKHVLKINMLSFMIPGMPKNILS